MDLKDFTDLPEVRVQAVSVTRIPWIQSFEAVLSGASAPKLHSDEEGVDKV